jgi:hypothetical protein
MIQQPGDQPNTIESTGQNLHVRWGGTLVAYLVVKFARPGTNLFRHHPAQECAADTARWQRMAAVSLCCGRVHNHFEVPGCLLTRNCLRLMLMLIRTDLM